MAEPTATSSGIQFRQGNFKTLCEALDYAATGSSGLNFFGADAALITAVPYAQLRKDAIAMAGHMAAAFPRLSRIGMVAETTPEFLTAFMACQYAGLVPASLSLPAAFSGVEAYQWQVSKMAETADLAAVFAPDELRDLLTPVMDKLKIPVLAMSGADLPEETAMTIPHGPDDPAYIQFSSGSTSDPKGIFATQKSVTANCRSIITDGVQITDGDRLVSWLPLYHDMGMVGFFFVPVYAQLSTDYLSAMSFARRPSTWLRIISEHGGTITYSPSFGYELCTRRYRGSELDLSSLRIAGIGGDMVRSDVLSAFTETFSASQFNPNAFVASYGLAETTLAVSFAPLGTGIRQDLIDIARMQTSQRAIPAAEMPEAGAEVRNFVACGRPLPSMQVRVLDKNDEELGERNVGRIFLKGDSLAAGYFRANEGVKPLTDETGWFETGDLGYWLGDEIVITGRSKDLILWNGRNIWPQDIEWVAQEAGGKNISRAAAIDIKDADGSQRILLLAECWSREADARAKLISEIAVATRAAVGAPVTVELVTVRSLPITSSGKLSRAATRARYLAGGFAEAQATNTNAADAKQNRGI